MTQQDASYENRRPLRTRSAAWAQSLASALAAIGLSPNAISTIGILFAAMGAWGFLRTDESQWFFLLAALGIQLRLLANMLDGLVAVESGKASATGPLFNEVPDRIEDALLLIAAGYAAGEVELGYGAALLAFGTAYVRATGGALGLPQDFIGPMAKQHRMFVLTLAALLAAFLPANPFIAWSLWLIVAGAALTCVIRTWRIGRGLRAKARGQ